MLCKQCNGSVDEDDKFCKHCSASLTEIEIDDIPETIPDNTNDDDPSPPDLPNSRTGDLYDDFRWHS